MTDIEGWSLLSNSRKWHYFINGESLCVKWFYPGWGIAEYEMGNDDSPDNCASCKRKLKKRKRRIQNANEDM